jgi:hypothetical protein
MCLFLAQAENQKYPNDFGIELELSARTAANNGLKLAMEQTTKVGWFLNEVKHSLTCK